MINKVLKAPLDDGFGGTDRRNMGSACPRKGQCKTGRGFGLERPSGNESRVAGEEIGRRLAKAEMRLLTDSPIRRQLTLVVLFTSLLGLGIVCQ